MSEQEEDMNAFNSWDCFGATLMLGLTPAVIHLATTRTQVGQKFVYDEAGTIMIALVGLIVALVVLAVALITRWKLLSKIINGLGLALTICYTAYMVNFWFVTCSEPPGNKSLSPEANQAMQAAPTTPQQ